MGLFDKFRQPPLQHQMPSQEQIDAMMYEDAMMQNQSPLSSGVPSPGMYGSPAPAFNEQMAQLAIGTHITISGREIESIDDLPTLFYFLTDNWRHFQLSNLSAKDQRYIRREIEDIHMLAGQGGNEFLAKTKQITLFNELYMFKSRSDMGRMTEREIWTLQTNAMHNDEIKRPKDGNSGFFSTLFGFGRSRGGD